MIGLANVLRPFIVPNWDDLITLGFFFLGLLRTGASRGTGEGMISPERRSAVRAESMLLRTSRLRGKFSGIGSSRARFSMLGRRLEAAVTLRKAGTRG